MGRSFSSARNPGILQTSLLIWYFCLLLATEPTLKPAKNKNKQTKVKESKLGKKKGADRKWLDNLGCQYTTSSSSLSAVSEKKSVGEPQRALGVMRSGTEMLFCLKSLHIDLISNPELLIQVQRADHYTSVTFTGQTHSVVALKKRISSYLPRRKLSCSA